MADTFASDRIDHDRRRWLAWAGTTAIAGCGTGTPAPTAPQPPAVPAAEATALLDDLERRTFDWFWETANPRNGLVPDRWPSAPDFASIASVGFALTAYVVGVERGYISRAQARDRVLATARFFADAPQGPAAAGMTGHRGFFYHWLHMETGARYDSGVELSTIDTALLLAGLLFVQAYFDGPHADEARIRGLVDAIERRVDWRWAQPRAPLVVMGWKPEGGFSSFIDYRGYDEAMVLYLLALGSPTLAVDPSAWDAFCATYPHTWGRFMGHEHLGGAPLFWHQYSHVWVDFRGIQDAFMRARGIDYFENSRRATLSQRAYAIANPGGWRHHGANVWGLTACDGPGTLVTADWQGRSRQFHDYRARGAGLRDTSDDGTIAPTAAAGSLPFAPEIVVPALREMRDRFGGVIYGRYGFYDAFNTSFTDAGAKLSNGKVVDGFGWVDTDYLGIDQGPIIAMIANHRDQLVWKTMRRHPTLRRGLQRAGFTGGWLSG